MLFRQISTLELFFWLYRNTSPSNECVYLKAKLKNLRMTRTNSAYGGDHDK